MLVLFDAAARVDVRMQFALRSIAGEFEATEFPIRSKRLVVGRGEHCDLRLLSPKVSRTHFLIERTDTGLVLTDLGSRNGTAHNGMQIDKAAGLKLGDRITLLSCEFRLISMPIQPFAEHVDDQTLRPSGVRT